MIRLSTPSDFQHCSSTELPAASTILPVERDVVLRERVRVVAAHRLAHRLELLLERGHVPLEPLGREPGGELLERGAHREDLDHLLLVEHAHARAAEGLRLDEPQELEVAQRLAHGRLARAELLRDPRLDEPLARLELPARDPLQQNVLDLLAEDRAGDHSHDLRQPAITGLVISPTPSIWIVTVSPGCSSRFGFLKTPTPAGVPVRIRSPASSVDVREA